MNDRKKDWLFENRHNEEYFRKPGFGSDYDDQKLKMDDDQYRWSELSHDPFFMDVYN